MDAHPICFCLPLHASQTQSHGPSRCQVAPPRVPPPVKIECFTTPQDTSAIDIFQSSRCYLAPCRFYFPVLGRLP